MQAQDIIALQKQVQQERFSSIHAPVTYINGKRYHFIEQEVPVARIIINLPREFKDMPDNLAKLKYPSEERPQQIKTSHDLTINFAFKLLQVEVPEQELIHSMDTMLDAMKRVYPQNTYLETGVNSFRTDRNRTYCWFEYYGPTLDIEAYSFNATMLLYGKPLYVLFNCPKEEYEKWHPIVFEAIETIRDKPVSWKGEGEK